MAKTRVAPNENVGRNLAALMARSEVLGSQQEVARRAGVGQTTVGRILRGEVASSAENLRRIASAFGYSAEVLYLDPGKFEQALQHATTRGFAESNVEDAGPATRIPVISWVQAGQWSNIVDNFQPGDADEWLPCPMRHGPRTYALVVRGVSMYNPGGDLSFKDGDKVFVDPDREAMHRSLVIVRLDDEREATFKQLMIEGEKRYLFALNPQWPERILPIDGNATLCGVVIGRVESFI